MIVYMKSSSKRKKKSSAKQKADKAMTDYINQKWKCNPDSPPPKSTYKLGIPEDRLPPPINSHKPTIGDTAKIPSPVYTGDKIVGISTMHKSNAIPVFSQEEAEDIAKMRR